MELLRMCVPFGFNARHVIVSFFSPKKMIDDDEETEKSQDERDGFLPHTFLHAYE
jgi:hypothetical protein